MTAPRVWVVSMGDPYHGEEVIGVFSTKKKAMKDGVPAARADWTRRFGYAGTVHVEPFTVDKI